ncbi:hypothetical protein Bca52824_023236 [Brassica carinata]|uniref:VWFA domain-containing protein n=1 Tax=Brassica carinata TaxID=52824 RepID=A0A8X8ASC9_BRACI|nr:hypothetical protein Bca52824_023236 [Brassica carinata]
MSFLIQSLGERDRPVVAFSSTARRLFPFRMMSETGKKAAIQAVNSLVAGGRTNIAEWLKIGAKAIEDRRYKNPVSGTMLLSDGQDNYTLDHSRVRLRTKSYESLLPSSTSRIPKHTSGFGSGHDAQLMHTISQVVEIECFHGHGLKITSIKSGSYRNRISSDARTATINVGDMYAEEERDFLVILDVPCGSAKSESMPLLKVRCIYKDPATIERVHVESEGLTTSF